ncbi:DUF4937 domain-containing protein [Shewanella sp.]|uniref:DUF4937 domain-containing protein n=1 Tax=Shewanella sp. TaxID=50422 RepID=UPI001EC8666D|nr:DUF4937 domain-containing protein [Shewanella sp.]NRB24591.1 DUF4937 domain-containing protein [Shewanella sp.]
MWWKIWLRGLASIETMTAANECLARPKEEMIKFIECQVTLEKRIAFSTAQGCWSQVSACPGFISQYGGWDQQNGNAVILSQWQSLAAIDAFMTSTHDKIFEQNQQHLTYETCKVDYFKPVQTMTGTQRVSADEIGFVRVADCKLKAGGAHRFLQDQLDIWTPIMSGCDGMLGGFVAQSAREPLRYMVISVWRDEQSHSHYMNHEFKHARAQVNLEAYIDEIVGYLLPTVTGWQIDN